MCGHGANQAGCRSRAGAGAPVASSEKPGVREARLARPGAAGASVASGLRRRRCGRRAPPATAPSLLHRPVAYTRICIQINPKMTLFLIQNNVFNTKEDFDSER